jgi:hypothetical protein
MNGIAGCLNGNANLDQGAKGECGRWSIARELS